jgi:hypothetical protein
MTGSNGVHRAVSFTGMMQHHSGEYAVGIDNWAALVINGDNYNVVSRKGKQGSVGADGTFSENRTGHPGIWKLRINDQGQLERTLPPLVGRVSDLLSPPKYIAPSQQLSVARAQNPDDGLPPAWTAGARHEGL